MERNESLLADLEEGIPQEPASMGTRLANYVIDTIAYYVLSIAISLLIALMQVQTNGTYYEEDKPAIWNINDILISISLYLLFFTLMEGITKGRSLGKLITGTVAVREDGTPFTWNDAFLRSLSRIVPFEPFSALGRAPWHDSWTKTTVVKKNP